MQLKIFLGIVFFLVPMVKGAEVICYVGSWVPESINKLDRSLCTSFLIAFATIDGNGRVVPPPNINDFLSLKTPTSKTLLSIGGATQTSWQNAISFRDLFALSCLQVCQTYGLDGVDIDWEFPSPGDRDQYTALLSVVSTYLKPQGLQVTVAISAGNWQVNENNIYNFPTLVNVVDGFNLMTYDIHMDEEWDIWYGTGFNAPKTDDRGESIESGVQLILSKGVPSEKIYAGIPFYGRIYQLQDPNIHALGSPFVPGYQSGNEIQNVPSYNSYCYKLNDPSWTIEWDNYRSSPFMYKGVEWMSYENEQSVADKARLSTQYNLGGVMIWAVYQDDLDGVCGVKQPLLRSVNSAIGRI